MGQDTTGEAPTEEAGETAQIPVSLLGGQTVSPGDVVRLKVVSVDEEGGSVTVEYYHPKQEKAEGEMGGIDEAVKQFEA